jgi:phasin family protein
MDNPTNENITRTATDNLAKSGQAAEKLVKGSADAITEGGKGSAAAVQDLTKAYQGLAAKNVENLMGAMQALSAVKSPSEFIEVQQRLIKDGVEAAVSDGKHIAQMTAAVFTAAFEPIKRQIDAAQKTMQN